MKQEDKELMRQDKPWFDEFMARHYPQKEERKKAKRKRIVWAAVCSCAAAIAIALTLILCLPRSKAENSEKKYYLIDDEVSQILSSDEINSNLSDISVSLAEDYRKVFTKIYDKTYNDTLYFSLTLVRDTEEFSENIIVYFYTNTDYQSGKEVLGNSQTETIGSFTVQYITDLVVEQDEDITIHKFTQALQSEYRNTRIYIEYSQATLAEQSDLLEFFARTLQVK